MGQDALRQPSPTGDREALRAGPMSGSKRARESSRSCIRSGDPSPSERRDGRSRDSCCRSLSSHDTPYRSCSRSPPKRHWERSRSPGRHHSHSLVGSWRTSPPGCRGSRSRSPASFHWRHSPSSTRWPSPKRRSSAPQTRWPSPQRRYSPYQFSCSSRHRSPHRAFSHCSRSSSGESCHQNRGLNSAWPTTSADQRMLLLSAVPSRHSVHDDDNENPKPILEKLASPDKNFQALTLEDFHAIFQETMKASSSDPESLVQPPVLSLCRHRPFSLSYS